MATRTQRGHRVRDQKDRETKRQRRGSVGQWVASKGNYIIDSRKGSKGGNKGDSKNSKGRRSTKYNIEEAGIVLIEFYFHECEDYS